MKTKVIISIFIILILIAGAVFAVCWYLNKKSDTDKHPVYDDVQLLTRKDIEAFLTNYIITIEYTDNEGNLKSLTEARSSHGYLFAMDNGISYLEYGTGIAHILDPKDKTGYQILIDDEDTYKTFGSLTSSFIFFFCEYQKSGAEKLEDDEILHRSASIYTCPLWDYNIIFWVDNEYGITLKSIGTPNGQDDSWEVTEFNTNPFSFEDIINLDDYKIKEIPQ